MHKMHLLSHWREMYIPWQRPIHDPSRAKALCPDETTGDSYREKLVSLVKCFEKAKGK